MCDFSAEIFDPAIWFGQFCHHFQNRNENSRKKSHLEKTKWDFSQKFSSQFFEVRFFFEILISLQRSEIFWKNSNLTSTKWEFEVRFFFSLRKWDFEMRISFRNLTLLEVRLEFSKKYYFAHLWSKAQVWRNQL